MVLNELIPVALLIDLHAYIYNQIILSIVLAALGPIFKGSLG